MPRETFQITVEVLNRMTETTAVATAASYLAYADRTDTIGYAPAYEEAVARFDEDAPIAVVFTVNVGIDSDEHLKRFMDEMAQLSRVMSVEKGNSL